jgi:hypothetical protein
MAVNVEEAQERAFREWAHIEGAGGALIEEALFSTQPAHDIWGLAEQAHAAGYRARDGEVAALLALAREAENRAVGKNTLRCSACGAWRWKDCGVLEPHAAACRFAVLNEKK